MGATPSDAPRVIDMPTGAFGDNMGGMTIAGGIAAALFARERTGEPSVVDVSLMSVGAWAMSLSVNIAMLLNMPLPQLPMNRPPGLAVNPLIGNYRTKDGRWINLTMLQPGRYWAPTCHVLGLEHLIDDERFADAESIMANAEAAGGYVAEAMASRDYAEWIEVLQGFEGQWAPNHNALEVAEDPQVVANDYVVPMVDAEGNERRLVASPVQFDETPFTIRRAPLFAEHTDDIIRELGYDDEQLINLKIEGTIT
jgi:crotonobetainyl-CoA:carnitine CoA-transferase CaiB-like acyl-CoA transferase